MHRYGAVRPVRFGEYVDYATGTSYILQVIFWCWEPPSRGRVLYVQSVDVFHLDPPASYAMASRCSGVGGATHGDVEFMAFSSSSLGYAEGSTLSSSYFKGIADYERRHLS